MRELLKYHTPTYDQEDIKLLVQRLYEKGNREDAEAIVDTYGRRGVHLLKEVWEANRGGPAAAPSADA